MSYNFQPGDLVICKNTGGVSGLKSNKVYTVKSVDSKYVRLNEDPGLGWLLSRFEKISIASITTALEPGDLVLCINNICFEDVLHRDEIYTVKSTKDPFLGSSAYIRLNDVLEDRFWGVCRFKKVSIINQEPPIPFKFPPLSSISAEDLLRIAEENPILSIDEILEVLKSISSILENRGETNGR